MNKVLVVEENNTNAEIFSEFLQKKFGIPFPCANSVEGAFEAFIENRPTILIVEIVLPNSRSEKERHDMIDARQHEIMEVQKKIQDQRVSREHAERMRVMDQVMGINFMTQINLLNLSGGLVLLKMIKEYCLSRSITMPKVLFYTTQPLYEHLQTLSEIFDDEQNYIWIDKMFSDSAEKVISAFQELIATETEVV